MRKCALVFYAAILIALSAGCSAFGVKSKTLTTAETGLAENGGVTTSSSVVEETKPISPSETPLPTPTPQNALPVGAVEPSSSPENSEDSEAILQEFMDSGLWLGAYTEIGLEVTSFKIFDFDGDGISELWIEAYEDSKMWNFGISRFFTVIDGQVEMLLFGEMSGGSIGGDRVVSAYDTLNNCHVIGLMGYAGGFGGEGAYCKYYGYNSGKLNEIANFHMTVYWADSDEDDEYIVDGNPLSLQEYEEALLRFTEPVDKRYILMD